MSKNKNENGVKVKKTIRPVPTLSPDCNRKHMNF